jgi:mannose-6-phosphate isomerase-like protein (cupin superfamily)
VLLDFQICPFGRPTGSFAFWLPVSRSTRNAWQIPPASGLRGPLVRINRGWLSEIGEPPYQRDPAGAPPAQRSGQIILVLDGALPAGSSGPPLHVHFREQEEIFVKSGTLGAQIGKEKVVVQAGGSAVLPASLRHRWWNAGDDLLEFSGQVAPVVDLDRYLQAVFAVLNASSSGRPAIFHFAHVLWRHRDTQLLSAPPRAIQRIVLPVLLFIGRILGKYRGSSWPGSPESCPGAPLVDANA